MIVSVVDLTQTYSAFKLLETSSLGSAGLWGIEKWIVMQVHSRLKVKYSSLGGESFVSLLGCAQELSYRARESSNAQLGLLIPTNR